MVNPGSYRSSCENKQHPHPPSLITDHRISVFHGPAHGHLDMCVITLEGKDEILKNPKKNRKIKIKKSNYIFHIKLND